MNINITHLNEVKLAWNYFCTCFGALEWFLIHTCRCVEIANMLKLIEHGVNIPFSMLWLELKFPSFFGRNGLISMLTSCISSDVWLKTYRKWNLICNRTKYWDLNPGPPNQQVDETLPQSYWGLIAKSCLNLNM